MISLRLAGKVYPQFSALAVLSPTDYTSPTASLGGFFFKLIPSDSGGPVPDDRLPASNVLEPHPGARMSY